MATVKASQDQRKRALEALERRFAVAEAELLQQQNKSKSKSGPSNEDSKPNSSARPTDAPVKDVEEDGPEYSKLSLPVHENLLATNAKFDSKRKSMGEVIFHELLQHGDYAQKYAQGSRIPKSDKWVLLDNLVQVRGKSTDGPIRISQTHSKRSKRRMSMKQHKKCGSLNLPKDVQKFDFFKPMHEMWKGYMMQLLKGTGRNQLAQCLLSADLHGAIILVAECKIISFSGVSGIMVRETAETFGIITQADKFLVVPKRLSVFIFQVDCWKITLHGDKLALRNLSP